MSDAAIPAATVLLLRDAPAFEVLMVERHAAIGFAGGALVFPGGRVDPGDRDPAWAEHAAGIDFSETVRGAAMIAAIREAFEEAGIILARRGAREGAMLTGDEAAMLNPWRKRVEADDGLFLAMVREEDLVLAGDALVPFARWAPPSRATHKRFDTWFFAARCPEGQTPLEDGDEATEALWIAPAKAVAAGASGARKIIFPTMRNLELLGVSASVEDALAAARRRKVRLVEPEIVERDGKMFLTIPDDLGYPVTEEALETAMRG